VIQVDESTIQEEESSKWKDAATNVFWGILAVPICICVLVVIIIVAMIMVDLARENVYFDKSVKAWFWT